MSRNKYNLEANSFYSVDDPTSLMETKLSFLKKAIEEHNIVSENKLYVISETNSLIKYLFGTCAINI